MKRRYEVRARACLTGLDIEEAAEKFFFRKNAESWCYRMNSVRLIMGHKGFTYYVHDKKDDND